MMSGLRLTLMLIAVLCFLADALDIRRSGPRPVFVGLTALGLALWALAEIVR